MVKGRSVAFVMASLPHPSKRLSLFWVDAQFFLRNLNISRTLGVGKYSKNLSGKGEALSGNFMKDVKL